MTKEAHHHTPQWMFRGLVVVLTVVAMIVMLASSRFFIERFTKDTRTRADVQLTLAAASFGSDLRRNSVVPKLLAQDRELIKALETKNFSLSTQHLLGFVEDVGASSLRLLDSEGRVVSSTQRQQNGADHSQKRYFTRAISEASTIFSVELDEPNGFSFIYAHPIRNVNGVIGVVSVDVDVRNVERRWSNIFDVAFLQDQDDRILLSSIPQWRGATERDVLIQKTQASTVGKAFQSATQQWRVGDNDIVLEGEAVLRRESELSGGWTMVSFTTYASVRERVIGVIALEAMVFTILLTLIFGIYTRKARFRIARFETESIELRALNNRLQREVSEREKAEKNLEIVGQTLAQSSKLAVLGEMSASVSHELNQPLAAMKTYLAGAQLLLERERTTEASTAFQRIDDLIDRMAAITKQLKSYARKGSDAFEKVDVQQCISTALSIMEPQLKEREIDLVRMLPKDPIFIHADRLRFEQVLINLVRNALDATKASKTPNVEILLASGQVMRLSIRDNGEGIRDNDDLFEPFYTTKAPGDGVGLGLAISSGIIKDFGGQLSARNAPTGGAVFEIELPVWIDHSPDI